MNYAKLHNSPADPVWHSNGIPYPRPKTAKKRVLVVGDSFVWGNGYVNANDIWWRQLERELHRRGYWGVEVVAAGLNGASTQDELKWLRDQDLLGKLQPDMVIVGYVTNDADVKDVNGHRLVKQLGEDVRAPGWTGLDRSLGRLIPRVTHQLKKRLITKWESTVQDAFPYAVWEFKLLEGRSFEAYQAIVAELGSTLSARKVPGFVVTLPNYPGPEHFSRLYAPVKAVFDAASVAWHDSLEDFVRRYPPGSNDLAWGINPANGHPARASTRFYASYVANLLEKNYPNILGVRSGIPGSAAPRINDWMPPDLDVTQATGSEWEFRSPNSGQLMPLLPFGKPHSVLSFEEPVAISALRLTGINLQAAQIYLTIVSKETGIEDKQYIELPRKAGSSLSWTLQSSTGDRAVNTIRVIAEVEGSVKKLQPSPDENRLRLKIDFEPNPLRP